MDVQKKPGLTGAVLKWTALLFMLLDHIGYVLVAALWRYGAQHPLPWSQETVRAAYRLLRILGRPAFPLFLFLLAEGFFHTRSRGRYLLRLGLFALLSELPFDLALRGKVPAWDYQNVFLTLCIGFAALILMETLRKDGGSRTLRSLGIFLIALAAPLTARLLHTDYGAAGVLALEAQYAVLCMRESAAPQKNELSWRLLRWCAMLPPLLLSSKLEWWMLLALPLACLYNGERGRQASRWFFYGFYPAHLLLLAGLRRLLFGG